VRREEAVSLPENPRSTNPAGALLRAVSSNWRTSPWDRLLDGRFRSKHPGRTLWSLFSGQYPAVFSALALYVLKQAPTSLLPLIVGIIIDSLSPVREGAWHRVVKVSGIYVALLACYPFIHALFIRLMSRVLRQMQFLLRSALVERLQQLAVTFYDANQSGALQSKILRDVDSIDGLCRNLLHNGLNGVLVIVYVTCIALAKQPLLALYFLVTVPAGVGLLKIFDRRFRRHYQALRLETEQMSVRVGDMLQMMPVTRAHGLEEHETRGVRTAFHRLRKRGLKVDLITELFAATSWVTFNFFQIACLIFSAYLVIHDKLTVGEAVMYHSYFGMLVGSVQQILGVFPTLAQGTEAIRSIGEVIEAPEVEDYANKRVVPHPLRGEIVFDHVGYSYPHGREVALTDISLQIHAGETIAFVGESGAGKSTLMNLAIGFRAPTSGRVLLDGQDLRTLDLRSFRQQIGVVPQSTILFTGTLRDNVTYGSDHLGDAALWKILEEANLAAFVKALPEGLDTLLGENGARLSGGQRQRLAIARALVRDPRVILLDEATSALDTESERLVQEALVRLSRGRTTLIVAHRFSTIRQADRIAVLSQGRLIELGTREELSALGGQFARLAALQA